MNNRLEILEWELEADKHYRNGRYQDAFEYYLILVGFSTQPEDRARYLMLAANVAVQMNDYRLAGKLADEGLELQIETPLNKTFRRIQFLVKTNRDLTPRKEAEIRQ